MIKAIIFDFFGVLVTERFKLFRDTFFPGDQEKWQEAINLVNRHDSGHISEEAFYLGLSKIANVSLDVVTDHMTHNKPNTPLIGFIDKKLHGKYKLGVLSNSGDDYISEMLDPKDVALFDDVLLSYRFGLVKPQPEIFELAAKRLDVKLDHCVFIDDSPTHCHGAIRAGMKAIHYDNFPKFESELEAILTD